MQRYCNFVNKGPTDMTIQVAHCIAKAPINMFAIGIMTIGPLLGDICMAELKMQSKRSPRWERVKMTAPVL